MTHDLSDEFDPVAAISKAMDRMEQQDRWKRPPVIGYLAKWQEAAAFLDISIRDGVPLEEVTHAHLQAEFQKYGFDDYEVFSGT